MSKSIQAPIGGATMTESPLEYRATDIVSPCPKCGEQRNIRREDWMSTIKAEREKTDKQRDRELLEGKIEGFTCPSCKKKSPNASWHRSYEREQFRARNWATPRMMSS
jgi:predicted RNA-binding Zn-ribbon protein involved in translation (DUF1610 family)